jgi:hypothetical protein
MISEEKIQSELQTTEVLPMRKYAETLVINDDASMQIAGENLKKIKAAIKITEEKFEPSVSAAHKAWKTICGLRSSITDELSTIEKRIKFAMLGYQDKVAENQRIKQAELDAAARREEEKKKADLESRADRWEERGNTEKADALRDVATTVTVAPKVVAPAFNKVSGVHTRDNWVAVITDEKQIPRDYLVPNMTALNALAKATKGAMVISGVKFVNEKSISSRSK